VWSRARGKLTLKLVVCGAINGNWRLEMPAKLAALPNYHAVARLPA